MNGGRPLTGNGAQAVIFTEEGGVGGWMINDTGANSIKGTIVEPSINIDNAVQIIGIDEPDPIGIIYDDGIADGELVRVVFTGRAEVLFVGSTTRHYFARNVQAGDTGAVNGSAIAETLPTPPFATDKHFLEIGHVLESRVGAGLALTMLHFN